MSTGFALFEAVATDNNAAQAVGRSVATKLEIAMISRNRSLESRVQFHHFRGPKTRNQSFADDDQFSAVSVGSAAEAEHHESPVTGSPVQRLPSRH
jgi:hypothetical protein